MRTNLIIAALLLGAFTVKSQVEPAAGNSNPASNTVTNTKSFATAGCVELGGSFSFTSQDYINPNGASSGLSLSGSQIIFAPYAGYFPINGFELGVNPLSISYQSYNSTSLLFIFAPSYNFNTHSIAYPFVEGEIGYSTKTGYSETSSGLCYGARVGVKLAIATHALIYVGVQYLVQTYNAGGASDGSSDNLVLGVGFSVYL